ncbi:MAG: NTP transferase domain-containing protein [Planctomycetes bacterium]|nr:NTP transferase domain-containing protein [Planctomycetota bacterium]
MSGLADLPVVILAGGRGARFDHESQVLPKPMISVAGKPILQHIIDGLVVQGFREFIVAGGYLWEAIDAWFHATGRGPFCLGHYPVGNGTNERVEYKQYGVEYPDLCGIKVVVVDTGAGSHTGERLVRLRELIQGRRFVLTYGDGLSDVQMQDVLDEHLHDWSEMGRLEDGAVKPHPAHQPPLLTLTAVNPPGRFGVLDFNPTYWHHVRTFREKGSDDWINGGFMIVESEFIWRYLEDDWGSFKLEDDAMPACAEHWRMRAYRHSGYWRCMDTRRDREQIEEDVKFAQGLPWRRDMMEEKK